MELKLFAASANGMDGGKKVKLKCDEISGKIGNNFLCAFFLECCCYMGNF